MTKHQIHWAAKHDWFVSTKEGVVTVRDDYLLNATLSFTDFNELYTWAGY